MQIFSKEKKGKDEQIAEEITITHTANYRNDSLADDYNEENNNYNEEEEIEENEENEENEDNNKKEGEGEKLETIDLGPIKNPNKEEKKQPSNNNNNDNNKDDNNKNENNNNDINKINNININEKENKIEEQNNVKKNNENKNKENKNEKNNEDNENKVKIDLNNDNSNNDKISHCHVIFQKGFDIDINTIKYYTCNEKISKLFTKNKYNKIQTLLFIDEHYLYFLKDTIINQNNPNQRRIYDKYDINNLFDYNINKKDNNKYEFILDFLLDQSFLDRKIRTLLFEEKEAEKFENDLLETLEKFESIFINSDENEDEEEEEIENEEDTKKKDKEKIDEKENKEKEKKERFNKKIFLRNVYGTAERKESSDSKSSSRFLFKNAYI